MTAETEDKTTQNWLKEVQKGYIRIGLLILLNKKPAHGYEIMKEIKNRTKGFWQPTAGGVYPILRDLEQSGYIKGQWQTQKNRRLKVYRITKSGQTILKRAIVKQSEIFNNISALFKEFARDVLYVQVEKTEIPNIPSMFSPFLEENVEESLSDLEAKRKQISEHLSKMRQGLFEIDRKISQVKKQSQAVPETST
jgi:PadR family transcriptional regulator, regulatory protein PadR